MLGTSSSAFDPCLRRVIETLRPANILELGCGRGKFGGLLQDIGHKPQVMKAVQRLFGEADRAHLRDKGYDDVIDQDIMAYFREGFDEHYNLILALDVIEHFLLSDIISILGFALYRADYVLLVWPSAHPQNAATHSFDRHRASFELRDLSDRFDVVYYSQTGFANMHFQHRYHIALMRGYMNPSVVPPIA